MEISVDRKDLQSLLVRASAIIPSRAVIPVTQNFRLSASDGVLRVEATDLTRILSLQSAQSKTREVGTALFPAKRLLDIVREAPGGEISISTQPASANIAAGRAEWQIRLDTSSNFPELPTTETSGQAFVSLDKTKFLAAMEAVRYAAAKSTDRVSLMMIDLANNRLTACDGVRFQQAALGFDCSLTVRIPIVAVDDLVRMLHQSSGEDFGIKDLPNHLVFLVGAYDYLSVNKLAAEYPNLEGALLRPALTNKRELTVGRDELLGAIKRVRVNADQDTLAVRIELSSDSLTIKAKDHYGNYAVEHVDASWKHDDHVLTVNHRWFAELLQTYPTSSCSFFLGVDTKTKKTPVLLRDLDRGIIGVMQQVQADGWT